MFHNADLAWPTALCPVVHIIVGFCLSKVSANVVEFGAIQNYSYTKLNIKSHVLVRQGENSFFFLHYSCALFFPIEGKEEKKSRAHHCLH